MLDEPLQLGGRVVDRLEEVELRIQLRVGGDHVLVFVFAEFPDDSLVCREKVVAHTVFIIDTYIQTYIHAYTHTCKHAFRHTRIHSYTHTRTNAFIHQGSLHTYIHTKVPSQVKPF